MGLIKPELWNFFGVKSQGYWELIPNTFNNSLDDNMTDLLNHYNKFSFGKKLRHLKLKSNTKQPLC